MEISDKIRIVVVGDPGVVTTFGLYYCTVNLNF